MPVAIFIGLLVFKDRIKENKVVKTKLEVFEIILTNEPIDWDNEISRVIDSMFQIQDTAIVE